MIDQYDFLISLGCLLIALASFWLLGWPGVVGFLGAVLVVLGLMGAARSGE